MNIMPLQTDIEDIANVDQQIEQHARNVEDIQRKAVHDIGREFSAMQDLHKYKRNGEGFTEFLSHRFPNISQAAVYQSIQTYKGLDQELFMQLHKHSDRAKLEIAKAEPDIQAIIAERVEAGEVFTAAQVKDIKDAAIKEANDLKANLNEQERADLEKAVEDKKQAEKRIEELEAQIKSVPVADTVVQPAFNLDEKISEATAERDKEISELKTRIAEIEADPAMKAMREAVADAARNGGKPASKSRKNPLHNPDKYVAVALNVTGPCRQLLTNSKKLDPAEVWKGFHGVEHREEGRELLIEVQKLISSILEKYHDE